MKTLKSSYPFIMMLNILLLGCVNVASNDGSSNRVDLDENVSLEGFSFEQSPSLSFKACADIPTKPVVEYTLADGSLDTSFQKAVTAYLYTDDSCDNIVTEAMTGSSTIQAVNGVADFTGSSFSYHKTGTYYWGITASDIEVKCIGPVEVLASEAVSLEFTTLPSSNNIAGFDFSTSPVVKALDGCGESAGTEATINLNMYTDAACTIAGSGNITLSSNPLTTTNASAAYSNLNYSLAGNYYLGATTSSGIKVCTSSTINISENLIDDDNTIGGFGGATQHTATTYSNNVLTLNTTTNNSEHDESWTPKWDKLVVYYNLNGSGTLANGASVTPQVGSDGTVGDNNASDISYESAKLSEGVHLDGTDDYINTGYYPTDDDHTLMYWVKYDTIKAGGQLLGVNDWSNHRFYMGIDPSGDLWYGSGLGGGYGTTAGLVADRWYLLTLTRGGGTVRAYVDDKLIESKAYTLTGTSSQPVAIGAIMEGAGSPNYSLNIDGIVDEVAIWNDDLTQDEIKIIYNRQLAKYSGIMESRIVDTGNSNSSWSNLDWLTPLPFGKELPDGGGIANSENSSDYSDLYSDTLLDGLMGLWHLNEQSYTPAAGEVIDSSGNNNHGTPISTTSTTDKSVFFRAGEFNNTLGVSEYIEIPNSATMENIQEGSYSFSVWYFPFEEPPGTAGTAWNRCHGIIQKQPWNFGLTYCNNGGSKFVLDHWNSGGAHIGTSTPVFPPAQFYHVVYTVDLANKTSAIYVNGKEAASSTYTGNFTAREVNQAPWRIGTAKNSIANYAFPANGIIDEAALWNRLITEEEILQLYRRGANRIKYQVRTCTNSDCTDHDGQTGNGWMGPGGNHLTYFSELHNNTSVTSSCATLQSCFSDEINLAGDVKSGSPSLFFDQFGNDGIIVNDNQYFQYRVIMESDDENTACDADRTGDNDQDATCFPELKSVEIGID